MEEIVKAEREAEVETEEEEEIVAGVEAEEKVLAMMTKKKAATGL